MAIFLLFFYTIFGSIVLICTKGLNYGIDFSGGTLIQVKYEGKAPLDDIRDKLAANEVLKMRM